MLPVLTPALLLLLGPVAPGPPCPGAVQGRVFVRTVGPGVAEPVDASCRQLWVRTADVDVVVTASDADAALRPLLRVDEALLAWDLLRQPLLRLEPDEALSDEEVTAVLESGDAIQSVQLLRRLYALGEAAPGGEELVVDVERLVTSELALVLHQDEGALAAELRLRHHRPREHLAERP